jgi:hypothetical protein
MILAFFLVGVSLLGLVILLLAVRGRSTAVSDLEDLVGRTRPVDLEAFRNLIDPAEEEFLRAKLPPRDFRAVQRERLRAAVDYVQSASHNAAILLRLGEAAARSADPSVAAAGQQMIDRAIRLRLYALLSTVKLYIGVALPGARLSTGRLVESYQQLSGLASQLALMQHPARAARFSSVL